MQKLSEELAKEMASKKEEILKDWIDGICIEDLVCEYGDIAMYVIGEKLKAVSFPNELVERIIFPMKSVLEFIASDKLIEVEEEIKLPDLSEGCLRGEKVNSYYSEYQLSNRTEILHVWKQLGSRVLEEKKLKKLSDTIYEVFE